MNGAQGMWARRLPVPALRAPAQIACAPRARTARYQSSNLSRAAHSIPTNPNSKVQNECQAACQPPRSPNAAALTSGEHHNDCENHFIVSDGGDVAKADGAEPRKDKVQGGAVAALWMERGQTRWYI